MKAAAAESSFWISRSLSDLISIQEYKNETTPKKKTNTKSVDHKWHTHCTTAAPVSD